MKKLLLISLLLLTIKSFAQFPNTVYSGSKKQISGFYGAVKGDSGIIISNFNDTSLANGQQLKNTAGILIKVKDTLFLRADCLCKWIKVGTLDKDSIKAMYPLQVYDSGGLTRLRIAYSWQDSALAGGGGILPQSGNYLISTGGISLAGNTVSIIAPIVWNYNFASNTRPTDFNQAISSATSGKYRKDIIYINSSGNFIYTQGVEDDEVAIAPTLPSNGILITIIDVFGSTITPPTIASTFQRNGVVFVNPSTGNLTSDSTQFSYNTATSTLQVGATQPIGTTSTFGLNSFRFALQGNFNGGIINVGSGLSGSGTYDISKSISFSNRGNNYLKLSSTSNTTHFADFLNTQIKNVAPITNNLDSIAVWEGGVLKKAAFAGGSIPTLQQVVDNSVASSEVYVNNRGNTLTWDSIGSFSFFKNYSGVSNAATFGFEDGSFIADFNNSNGQSSLSVGNFIVLSSNNFLGTQSKLDISPLTTKLSSNQFLFTDLNNFLNPLAKFSNSFNSDSNFYFNGSLKLSKIYPSTSPTDSALVINANGGVGKRAISSGGGTTKYTTNGFGTLVDSTTNLYTIGADTNTTAKLRDAKLNTLTDSISAHNVRIGANTTNIASNTSNIALKLNSSDSSIYQSKFRSDTSRINIYNTIALKGNGTVTSIATGYGLTGGTITTSGTLVLDTNTTAKLRDAAINAKLNTTDAATTYYPLTGGSYLSEVNGNGFLGLKAQTTPPTVPTSGLVKLYANSTGRLSWLTSLGFSRTINSRPLTADRTYTFYDRDYTVADSADVSLKSNIESPTFTGTPTAPTAAIGTNTTQLATTAYVQNAINRNYLSYYRFFTDFISGYGSGTSTSELFSTSSGTGAGFTMSSEVGRPGIYVAVTGTTATGRHSLNTPNTSTTLGGGTWTYETMLQVPTLSNGTDRFQTLAGFFDNNTGVNQVDGIYFLYDEGGVSTGSTASANLQIVTSSNSVRTFTNTSTAVTANQWYRLTIVVNAAASSVSYFIDGASAGTITTNIPSGTVRQLGWGFLQNKSLGTTSRFANFDAMLVEGRLTTPR